MQRIQTEPRNGWQAAVENLGFGFHSTDVPYWDESVYYSFRMEEIVQIEKASSELWTMCLDAVQHVIDEERYTEFGIPEWAIPLIHRSWTEDHPALYGRFDLCYKNGQLKLLEFNADTPTSLYEAGIVQWFWLQERDKSKDQFNSIHEKLIDYWKYLKAYLRPGPLHFTCLKETLEDLTNTEYLRDCAIQAGLDTKLVFVDDIGWDGQQFVDLEEVPVRNIFKLYPWEWLLTEEFGRNIGQDVHRAFWIEPPWKMILSNKAILAVLWELYPYHPLLLPAYFEPGKLKNFVKKPILGREGANINIVREGELLQFTEGQYGKEGYIFQELFELPEFDGRYPVIGSWIIGQEPAGMGIREADGLVTDNKSRFVPHLIEG
ncbi:MAG: glutathionylspermidine synthase family protein [Chitinophagaceae bacterium]|nr:MAG: glutathionylspermidine synthase family protein [Chitinophagaceae bacterium]